MDIELTYSGDTFTAVREDGKSMEVTLGESEMKANGEAYTITEPYLYEDTVLMVLYEDMLAEIEELILGDNVSPDCVTRDLFLMEQVDGYPFVLSWSSNNYFFLSASGEVATWKDVADTEEKEALVEVTMRAEYEDFVREHIFFVRVCPLEGEMDFSEEIAYALESAQRESQGKDRLCLPKEVGEKSLSWSEKKKNSDKSVFLTGLAGGIIVCAFCNKDLQREKEKRVSKMVEEYPTVISKLTLYLGAGLNLKSSFRKIAEEGGEIENPHFEFQKKKSEGNPVYEEMLIACREMESGISEGEAYENLGKRINRKQYIRLSMLLAQNLKKGNAELLTQLKQEAYLALEEKNRTIRKIGEEAGTKLLLPMMLMLTMVMVLIMVPAFLTI